MKVLIVDDDKDTEPLFNQVFRKEIKNGVFEFEFKFSTEEALEFLSDQKKAGLVLILSDISMPGRNGIELLKDIKESGMVTPIFLFIAYDDPNNRILSEKFGANKYLLKPINFTALKNDILKLNENLKDN